jgi:hypothetical protein
LHFAIHIFADGAIRRHGFVHSTRSIKKSCPAWHLQIPDMKTRLITLVIGFAVSLSLGLLRTPAEMEVSVGVSIHDTTEFYEPLAPSGTWVDGSYGRCWHPAGVAADWRPYCNGSWEWTDSGWYWASDEPWAWACYHYGTWAYDSGQGWVWVPGVEWAPAWVNWRVGGDYVGWVPCSPPGFVVAPSYYVFVEGRNFGDRVRLNTVIINNQNIFSHTTETAAARREGPGVDQIEKATGKKFAAVPVREADRQTTASIPEKFKSRTVEPANPQKPSPVQQQPKEQSVLAPVDKLAPGENPEKSYKVLPNQETPAKKISSTDRIARQVPPEKVIPPPDKETPLNREQQSQREITPPNQSQTPRGNPNQGGNAQGSEKDKDKNKEQGGGQDLP